MAWQILNPFGLQPGDQATWVASLLSSIAILLALVQIGLERGRRLRTEALEIEEKRRQRATKVAVWITGEFDDPMPFALRNAGVEPIYRVVVSLVSIQGAGPPRDAKDAPPDFEYRAFASLVPPGQYFGSMPYGGHGVGLRFGLEIAFTVAAGDHWIRKGTGELCRTDAPPLQYYGVDEPIDWQTWGDQPLHRRGKSI